MGLKYTELIPVITKALQELNNQNQRLIKEDAALKAYICAKDPNAPFCSQ